MKDMLEEPTELLAEVETKAAPVPTLPQFTPCWWYKPDRLDARPVAWSLRHHPEDWVRTEFKMTHKPSMHSFWIANGMPFYHLYDANCSCAGSDRGRFQRFQQLTFHRAFKSWKRWDAARSTPIHPQFASHFIY